MDIRKLQRAIVDGLEDVKAQAIVVFNTEHLSSMFERVIIASGASNRQTRALASSVRTSVKGAGLQVLRTEGEDNGEWIIVDCGAAVVHVMQPAIREYYHLEEIWGGKAVNMKMGGKATGLVKASEPEPAPPTKRRASVRSAAAGAATDDSDERPSPRAAARSAEARKGAPPAPPASATKAPARTGARTAAKKAAPVRFQVGAGKAPARTAGTAASKSPVKAPARAAASAAATPVVKPLAKPPAKPAAKIKTLVVGKPAAKKTATKKTATKTTPARKKVVARKGPLTKVASRR